MDFPFELRDGRMWVEANLKDSAKLGIFDTGADGTAIDQGVSDELGLKRGEMQSATLVAGEVEVATTDPVEFRMGGTSLVADEANILPLSTHIKGLSFILGFDASGKRPFTLDYSRSLIRFGFMPEGLPAPFVLGHDTRPTTELRMTGARIPALLDTGSGAGVSFPLAWVKKNLSSLPLGETQRHVILGSEYKSQKFILEEILLGGIPLPNAEARSVVSEEGSYGDQERDSAEVGNAVLRMFRQVGIDGGRRFTTFVRR